LQVFKTSGKEKLLHLQGSRKEDLFQVMANKRSEIAFLDIFKPLNKYKKN